ncbi:MAG TPA: hypothetical protein VJT54_16695 [Verrucomicrobiae bacterium]|nr:hypothetical protein [Verrucomicrobiae bacterium]
MKPVVVPLFAASALFLSGGCATNHEQAATKWEYQEATNSEEANQMAAKGWMVAGFSRYTDATGQPQVNYMMKRPKP